MSKIPITSGREIVKAFERAGFVLDRIKGSHHVLKKPGVAYHLSVPVHPGRTVGPGLLKSLIGAAGMTVDEFVELLK